MPESKHLGVYCGTDAVYFVESVAKAPKKIFKVPFGAGETSATDEGKYVPSGMQLNSALQEAFKKQKIHYNTANLALPTRDIIFRSFVIPWMQANEIKRVVEFEANKYIPFSLEDLSYSYQTTTITDDGIKRIRVIFVAIKKDALQKYTEILEQVAMEVEIVEPAPLSLSRILTVNGFLQHDQTRAIIEKTEDLGKIIIIDKGIPQFVREFQLKTSLPGEESPSPKDILLRLCSEIRISLDYFNRQDNLITVKEILLLTPTESSNISRTIEDDLGLPVVPITTNSILNNEEQTELDYLYAYGMASIDPDTAPAEFNLTHDQEKKTEQLTTKSQLTKNYKNIAATAIACVALIVCSLLISNKRTSEPRKQIASITEKLGLFADAPIETIKTKQTAASEELANYQKIRTKGDATLFLALIPRLLPKGAWIEKFTIDYRDRPINTKKKNKKKSTENVVQTQKTIDLSGYAYQKNTKEQFNLVNTFIARLKKDKQLSEMFEDIDLDTVKIDEVNDFAVTYFKIKFQ